MNLDGQWEVELSEISYSSMYQNVTEGNFMFEDEKISKTTEACYLEPGLYSSITDIMEAMDTIIQERNNHRDTWITITVSRVTQKVKVYLAKEESRLAIFSTDLRHIFGGDVRNGLGIFMSGERSASTNICYDIVPIHSLMIFTDIVEYNIVGDTKAPLLRCFPFTSKLKSGDIITTGKYMNYQTFSNLQFRRFMKNSSHSIHIDLRGTSGEKVPFVLVGRTRLVLMFGKVSDIHFVLKVVCKMVEANTLELPYYKGIGRQRGPGFGALAQFIGGTAILFLRKYIVPAAKRVGAVLLEFAVPEVADVVSGKKNFKTAAKSVGRQTMRKQHGDDKQKRSIPVKNLKRKSRSRKDSFTNIEI